MVREDNMDALYKHPNPIVRLFEHSRRKSIIKLTDYSDKILADVGCERCPITRELVDKCKKIYCLDINPKFLDEAKNYLDNNKVKFIVSDAQKIRLKDNSSDITICTEVLEHLPHPEKCIKELKRITKQNGEIIISVPNEEFVTFIKKIIKFLRLNIFFKGIAPEKSESHLHIFNRKKIIDLVKEEKLEIEKVFYSFPLFTTIFLKAKNVKR